MNRKHSIGFLLDNMFANPTPKNTDWEAFLAQMTDEEIISMVRVVELNDADLLTKNDLLPFIKILKKYHPGLETVICEDHDPAMDLWEEAGELNIWIN